MKFISLILMIALSGCLSTKNGDSAPANPFADTDGKELNYGFMSNNYEIVEEPMPSPSTNTFIMNSVGYINIADDQNNVLDFMVFKPTCLRDSSSETYSMVLVGGSGPNKQSIKRSKGALEVFDYQFKNHNTRVAFSPNDNYSTSCSSGKTTVNTQGTLYANGSIAVYESNGDIYFGVRDSLAITSGTPTLTGTKYEYFSANAEVIEGSQAGASNFGLVQTNHSMSSGVIEVFGFNSTLSFFNQNSNDTSSHISLLPSSNPSMKGIMGTIGGKRLLVAVYESDGLGGVLNTDSSCYPDQSDNQLASCNGVGSIVVYFEN